MRQLAGPRIGDVRIMTYGGPGAVGFVWNGTAWVPRGILTPLGAAPIIKIDASALARGMDARLVARKS